MDRKVQSIIERNRTAITLVSLESVKKNDTYIYPKLITWEGKLKTVFLLQIFFLTKVLRQLQPQVL